MRVAGKETAVESPNEKRIEGIRRRLAQENLDGLLVSIAENRRYLSGYTGEDTQFDESAGALIITADRLVLATDARFTLQAAQEAPLFEVFETEKGLAAALPGLTARLGVKRLGFESRRISCYQHAEMTRAARESGMDIVFEPVEETVEPLRLQKDESEIMHTRTALAAAEKAFRAVVGSLEPGMTEKEIAWNMEAAMRSAGADGPSFPTIVAAGPNSALPHAVPGDRRIKTGEPILFDWGARRNGYCSDTSRTVFLGKPDPTFLKVHDTVRTAQEKAVCAIRPGADGKAVDAVARGHIEGSGYKGKFGHGLGHGTGLAVHEGPRLSPLSTSTLAPGMIVTVEPGIYIEKWGGVRIENQIVVRDNGAEVLTTLETAFDITVF